MVHVEGNKYYCEWCGEDIEHTKKIVGKPREYGGNPYSRSAGHSRVSNMLNCPSCGNIVSQKKISGAKQREGRRNL